MTLQKGIICLLVALTCYFMRPNSFRLEHDSDDQDHIFGRGRDLSEEFWDSEPVARNSTEGGMAHAGQILT